MNQIMWSKIMKNKISSYALMFFFVFSNQAFALGYDVSVESTNNTFKNSGEIKGTQTVAGGVATQKVGQRVVAPTADWGFEYKGHNNTYTNSGKISGVQTSAGGVGLQAVGQEVN